MVTSRSNLADPEATIVALSSSAGYGARAIVRMTGKSSTRIARELVPSFVRSEMEGRRFLTSEVMLPGIHSPLPTDVYFYAAPRTYTGQDIIEFHTLASPPLMELLIARCLNAGARAALSGEFTLRAFLAGKLDLTRAEAVLGVIEAGSRDELRDALTQLAGGLAHPLQAFREELLTLLADVEAGLDFAEEEVTPVRQTELLHQLAKGMAQLTLIRKQIEQRAKGQRLFRVALAGPPNAGKSSLFNALIGTSTALVDAEPGTTRDYLEKKLEIEGIPIELIDTAGLHDAIDPLDASAQSLGRAQTEQADLILWCIAPGSPATPPTSLSTHQLLPIATKADLGPANLEELSTSAVTGQGLEHLRRLLAMHAQAHNRASLAPSLSRCRHHVEACLNHLRLAHRLVIEEEPAELLALELRLALEELGAIVGAVYTEDLLDRVFSRFCIGK